MKVFAHVFFAAGLCLFAVACGDGGSGGGGGNGGGGTNQTCQSSHTCVNGSCTCETEGKSGESCTDDDKCVDECEVCK